MNLPCLFVPNELSDEAAACVAELLLNFAHAFDSQYATHICRHYDELRQPPSIKCSCDDRQLDLFEGDDVTF